MSHCTIECCTKPLRYPAQGVCQMHYFRFKRTGRYDLAERSVPPERRVNQAGYVMLYRPGHPLEMKDGYVYEHRLVVFERFGHDLPACEICLRPTSWATCHVDHRDETVDNNADSNLRPLCNGCNVTRRPSSLTPRFEFEGQFLTLTELSRLPGVTVGRSRVKQRLALGFPLDAALFSPNMTHPNHVYTVDELAELRHAYRARVAAIESTQEGIAQ